MLAEWSIRLVLWSGFCSTVKRLRLFVLPLDGILVHCRVPPGIAVYLGGKAPCVD